MLTKWMERAFDVQSAPARFVVLAVLTLGDLRLMHRPEDGTDWALALGGLLVCLAGPVAPLAAPIGVSGLLVLGDQLGANASFPLKVMIAVTLTELALRTASRRTLAGIGVVAVLLCWHAVDTAADLPATLFRLAVLIGLPLLLGACLRLLRERAAEQERLRVSETQAARAAERAAIARELHDLVAHHVSSMVLRVGVARHVLPGTDPRVTEVLDDLHGSGAAALADLRHLVAVLRDPDLAHGEPGVSLVERDGLPDALHAAAERGRRSGMDLTTEIDPGVAALDAVSRLTVLRFAQEGLANVARHAGPSATARLAVRVAGGTVQLELVDEGGPPPSGRGTPGHGLIGMTERVELLGGTLTAGPRPGERGWRLRAELPVAT